MILASPSSTITIGGPIQCVVSYRDQCAHNVNVLRNDNNVARVKSKRIETSICSIINIKLSKPIFGLPMLSLRSTKIKISSS